MAILQKIETTNYIYKYELSDDELKLYREDEDTFWENFDDDNWGDDPYIDVDSHPSEIIMIEK